MKLLAFVYIFIHSEVGAIGATDRQGRNCGHDAGCTVDRSFRQRNYVDSASEPDGGEAAIEEANELNKRAQGMDYAELAFGEINRIRTTFLPGLVWSISSFGVTSGALIGSVVWFAIFWGYLYRSDRHQDWAAQDRVRDADWRPHGGSFGAEATYMGSSRRLDIRPDLVIVCHHPDFDNPDKEDPIDVEAVNSIFVKGTAQRGGTQDKTPAGAGQFHGGREPRMSDFLRGTFPRTADALSRARLRMQLEKNPSILQRIFPSTDELAVPLESVRKGLLRDLYDALESWGFDVLVFSSIDNDEIFMAVSVHNDETLYHYLEAFNHKLQIQSVIAKRLGVDFSGWEKEAASSPPYVRFDHRLVERLHQCYCYSAKALRDHSAEQDQDEDLDEGDNSAMAQDGNAEAIEVGADPCDDAPASNDIGGATIGGHSTTTRGGATTTKGRTVSVPSPEGSWLIKGPKQLTRHTEDGFDMPERILPDVDPRHLWRTFHGGKHEGGCIVDSKERLLVIFREISRHLDLDAAKETGIIADWYPVHSRTWIKKLKAEWGRLDALRDLSFVQPVTLLQEYFGPRLAFRLAWTGMYCKALLALLPLALLCELGAFTAKVGFGVGGVDRMMIASFNIVVIIWSKISYNSWCREEEFFGILWGMTHEEEENQKAFIRPQFKGRLSKAVRDRNMQEKTYPSSLLFLRWLCTASVTLLFCTFVWVLISFWYTVYGGKMNLTASILVSLQIKIFEAIWNSIAPALAEFENHKYPDDYYASYVWKLYLFQAVNSYAAFVYTAVNLRWTPAGCPPGGCLALLRMQLMSIQIILSVSHVLSILWQVRRVDFALWYESFELRRHSGSTLREEFQRLYRKGFDPSATTEAPPEDTTNTTSRVSSHRSSVESLPERSYAEEQEKHAEFGNREQIEATCMLMISLGCIIIFGAVAPIMVPFCLGVFALELRFTAYMLVTHAKRPVPGHRLGIGAWKNVLSLVMKAGIMFSGFLLVTYSDTFRGTGILTKFSGAVGFFVCMILVWEVVGILWPPTDKEVVVLAGRRARVEHRIHEVCRQDPVTTFASHPRQNPKLMLNTKVRNGQYSDIPSLYKLPHQYTTPRRAYDEDEEP